MLTRVLSLTVVAAGLSLAGAGTAAAQGMQAPKGTQRTITGTVVDVSCKFGQGLTGDQHRMCAEVCSDRGIPLAILTADGKLYIPVSAAMPGDAQNSRLKPFAEQRVRVTGRVVNQHGQRAIFIDDVARAT